MTRFSKEKLITTTWGEPLLVINGETCIGVWDEDLEFVFKQAIDNLNLENEFQIIKPAYYTDGKKADGKIALTHTMDIDDCSEFWNEVEVILRKKNKSLSRP